MNRRRFVAAVSGVALAGGAGYAAFARRTNDVAVTVDTIDARGSTAGRTRLPVPGRPTLIDLFATWCVPCIAQMRRLVPAYESFGDDVEFVSVTNERIGETLTVEDIRRWWSDHGGRWTVGHDPESRLMSELGAGGLPFLALTDDAGEVVWTHRGVASESQLREQLAAVA